FTITVCAGDVTLPHPLVVIKVIEYVPGVTKLKFGLADVALVPPAKLHVGVPLPQFPAVYETFHWYVGGSHELTMLVVLVALTLNGVQPLVCERVNCGVSGDSMQMVLTSMS